MGNHRFKLSNMMPNAWFYKLKDMSNKSPSSTNKSRPLNQNQNQKPKPKPKPKPPPFVPSRASYYFPSNSPLHPKALDTHFPLDPPRKSNPKPRKTPICTSDPHLISSNDIILDLDTDLKLTPIITKQPPPPPKKEHQQNKLNYKKFRIRATSPKVRFVQRSKQRKGLGESLVVVKHSCDPKKEFRDSMMEMIMENELREAKDLEELLACFLSLNLSEYHDLIVKVFEEIWFDINDIVKV